MLIIGVACFVAYGICIGIENKKSANMIASIAFVLMLLATVQDLTPIIQRWSARVDSLQNSVDKVGNFGKGSWEIPIKGTITQGFNPPKHHGIDYGAMEGEPVKATRKGEVTMVQWHDIYGNMVVVDHGDGFESLYAHLSGISVKVGWPVIAGTQIGACGNTGNSNSSHLHFEIRKNGTCINALDFVK